MTALSLPSETIFRRSGIERQRILAAKVHPSASRPFAVLDVAGGTGDVAFRVARAGGPQTRVTVADIKIPPEAVRRDAAMRVEGLAAILC